MTKNEEIKTLHAIIDTLPADSYLRSTLVHIRTQFENDIRSDFDVLPNLREIRDEIIEGETAILNLTKQRHQLTNEVAMLTAKIEESKRQIADHVRRFEEIEDRARTQASWLKKL